MTVLTLFVGLDVHKKTISVALVDAAASCQRRREDASAGRSKNASLVGPFSGSRSSAFQFDQLGLLSRPDLASPGRGAQRRGWEERSHAQHREHGEHRTFPAASTVAG